jgi:Protein of unknown function (DUF550)
LLGKSDQWFTTPRIKGGSMTEKKTDTVPQLLLEIRNLAHRGWEDRPNAEFLFREIGKKAQQASEIIAAHCQAPRIQEFWNAQAEWSQATFGTDSERDHIGPLKHLAKEAVEAQVRPSDPVEIADCLFLVFDAARRSGMTLDTLIEVAEQKLLVNKARKWSKPTDDNPVEHVREGAAAPSQDTATPVAELIVIQDGSKRIEFANVNVGERDGYRSPQGIHVISREPLYLTAPSQDTATPLEIAEEREEFYGGGETVNMDHLFRPADAAPPQDTATPPVCGCCGRGANKANLRRPLKGWVDREGGLPEIICSDCMAVWYDGETDPEKIKAKVLGEVRSESTKEKP